VGVVNIFPAHALATGDQQPGHAVTGQGHGVTGQGHGGDGTGRVGMNLADLLNGFGGPWSYPVIGLFAFLESAAFVGLVIPGETAVLLGGVLAATGQVTLLPMVLAGVLGAVLGDLAGYGLGRLAGPAVRNGRAGRWVGEVRWRRAEELVARRGGPAVFVGRWIGLLRAVVPFVAGSIRMPRAQFMAWNAVGGTLWATTVICLG